MTDRGDIVARAAELGADLERGAGVIILRAAPRAAQTGEWRARVLTLAMRALRSLAPGLAGERPTSGEVAAEIAVIVPAEDDERLARAAAGLARELDAGLAGFHLTIGHSRRAADPVDLYRAGQRGAAGGQRRRGRGHGAARLRGHGRLPPAAAGDERGPGELERFYAETIEPLSAYDEQYETELVATVEAYLDNDGNVAATAKQLFTHRHTIRYRLERVQGALRPRRLGHRGPREARPRAQGDARPRHRLPARAGARARRRSAARCRARRRSSARTLEARPIPGEDSNPRFLDQNQAC